MSGAEDSRPPAANGATNVDGDVPPGPSVPGVHYQLSRTLHGHTRAVSGVQYKPRTGELLASCSGDKTLKVWNVNTGDELRTYTGHTQGISDVCWNEEGSYICSASDDRTAGLWDVEKGVRLRTFKGHTSYVSCCTLDPTGRLLATGSYDETINMWDVRSKACLRRIPGHSDPITAVGYSFDGTLLVSSSFDGICRLWDTSLGKCLKTIIVKDNPPLSHGRFSPNGRYILVASLNSKMRLMDIHRGKVCRLYEGHINKLYCSVPSFTHVGPPLLVAGSEDGTVHMWDVNTKKVVQILPSGSEGGHQDAVLCSDAHPIRSALVTGAHNKDMTIKLWEDSGANGAGGAQEN